MGFLIETVLFFCGLAFGIMWFAFVILPLIYGIPKSLWWVIKRRLKWWAPLKYLVAPIVFCVVTTLVSLALLNWVPSVPTRLMESASFSLAQLIAIGFSFISSIFSSSTRASMKSDFESFVETDRL
jgi:hypothetical protein